MSHQLSEVISSIKWITMELLLSLPGDVFWVAIVAVLIIAGFVIVKLIKGSR